MAAAFPHGTPQNICNVCLTKGPITDLQRPDKSKEYWICKDNCQDLDRNKGLKVYHEGDYSDTTDGQDTNGDRVRLCCTCGTSGRTRLLKYNRIYKAYICHDYERPRCDVRRAKHSFSATNPATWTSAPRQWTRSSTQST